MYIGLYAYFHEQVTVSDTLCGWDDMIAKHAISNKQFTCAQYLESLLIFNLPSR
jgi:hypothetical protein